MVQGKFIKITVLVALPILSIFSFLYYTSMYGLSFPPCHTYEIPLEAPELMKTSDIVFEKPMYYIIHTTRVTRPDSKGCSKNIEEEALGSIGASNEPWADYQKVAIDPNTRFKLIRRAYVNYRGITDFEGSKTGDYYLLKDDKDRYWSIHPIYFLNSERFGNVNENKWIADYYQGNQRVGDIEVLDVWRCYKGDKLEFCSEEY